MDGVLIETLWNVKLNVNALVADSVEVLIETLWNVKMNMCFRQQTQSYRFNRNIVECKVKWMRFVKIICIVLIETLWNVKTRFVRYCCKVLKF